MTAVYHITHFDNLPGILSHGGLVADTQTLRAGLTPISIAHVHIKHRRARTKIATPPGGTVADYVPFYFCPRSPMLSAIHGGRIEGYPGGQRRVLHLVCEAEAVVAMGNFCVHTDGNAATLPIQVFPNTSGFSQLSWDVINSWSWHDRADDNDRKRRKQAEFLVWQRLPWQAVSYIGVIDAEMANAVKQHLTGCSHQPEVEVRKDWYYE